MKKKFIMPTEVNARKQARRIVEPFCKEHGIDPKKVKFNKDLWGSGHLNQIEYEGYIYEFIPFMRHSGQRKFYWDSTNPGWENDFKQGVDVRWWKKGEEYEHDCEYCEHWTGKEERLTL